MARILVISSRVPYPLTGGAKLRIFNTGKILANEHTVDILVMGKDEINTKYVNSLEETFNNVIPFSYSSKKYYLNALPGILSNLPLQTFYFNFDEIYEWIGKNKDNYDLFYCNHVRTTEYVRGRDKPKVVDLVDAISRNYAEAKKGASGFWRLIYPVESKRLLHYEREIVREFDKSFITSEADKEYIQTENDPFTSLSIIPNGVKDEIVNRTPSINQDTTRDWIVFLGKMDYFPNEDAATYFANEIFPAIRKEHSGTKFLIVGTNPSDTISKLESKPGIQVTGFVDDPAEYLAKARVVVAPMRFGAGIQNKILEAMALGKPVVTTPLGNEGINAKTEEHLVVSNTTAGLTNRVIELLNDREYRERIGRNARGLIQSEYTWDSIKPELLSEINSLIQGR